MTQTQNHRLGWELTLARVECLGGFSCHATFDSDTLGHVGIRLAFQALSGMLLSGASVRVRTATACQKGLFFGFQRSCCHDRVTDDSLT